MQHVRVLVPLVLALLCTRAVGAEDATDKWQEHYDLLMGDLSVAPAAPGESSTVRKARWAKASKALPLLQALLIARPAAWARTRPVLADLVARAPDDTTRRALIDTMMRDPDAAARAQLDGLLPKYGSAFDVAWTLRLAEEGGVQSARFLRHQLAKSKPSASLVLPAAWLAARGDTIGKPHLLWALGPQGPIESDPTPCIAAARGLHRLLGTWGPWHQARATLTEHARKHLVQKKLDEARKLLALLEYAEHFLRVAKPRYFDLRRQVIRHTNLKRHAWPTAEKLHEALRRVEKSRIDRR